MQYITNWREFLKKELGAVISVILGVACLIGSLVFVSYTSWDCENCVICADCTCPDEENSQTDLVAVDIKGAVVHPGVYTLTSTSKVKDALENAGGVTTKGSTKNINLSASLRDEMVIYIFTEDELARKESANEIVCELPKCECPKEIINTCPQDDPTLDSKQEENINTNRDEQSTKPSQDEEESKEENEPDGHLPNDEQSEQEDEKKPDDSHLPSEEIPIDPIEPQTHLVSINTASVEELTKLDGIGLSKAEAIVKYREENGLFTHLEDIQEVKGIGKVLFEKIKDKISL